MRSVTPDETLQGLRKHLKCALCTLQSTDEAKVPLLINCWPSASGAESYVNIEYESTVPFDLHNVAIAIPVTSTSSAPHVNQVSLPLACAEMPTPTHPQKLSAKVLHPRQLCQIATGSLHFDLHDTAIAPLIPAPCQQPTSAGLAASTEAD